MIQLTPHNHAITCQQRSHGLQDPYIFADYTTSGGQRRRYSFLHEWRKWWRSPRKMKAAADDTSLANRRCADNHDDDEYEGAIEQGEERWYFNDFLSRVCKTTLPTPPSLLRNRVSDHYATQMLTTKAKERSSKGRKEILCSPQLRTRSCVDSDASQTDVEDKRSWQSCQTRTGRSIGGWNPSTPWPILDQRSQELQRSQTSNKLK